MCGITGAVPGVNPEMLRTMTARLAHRGPDGEGYLCNPQVSLGHRRLAVIDLASGEQPMNTPDGRYTIIYNGEIYNFREIRRELEAEGGAFRTQSDTEVLLQTLALGGTAGLARLRGMFALALWDSREQSLLLVRDRLGVKPLYYTVVGRQLLFASEIKALLVHPSVSRRLHPAAMDDFLAYLYVPGPQTIFAGIFELPPAHWLRWHAGELTVERYWDAVPQEQQRDEKEWTDRVRAMLAESVRLRMVSDVPLGAFLSGGVDSSSIVGLMAGASAEPVQSFSLGFEAGAERYSELEYARLVSKRFQTLHRELEVHATCAALLPKLVSHFDQPFGNPTALLLYQLSELTRRHVTVALAGDGGDEVFLGYPRHRGVALRKWLTSVPATARAWLARAAGAMTEKSNGAHGRRRVREFLQTAAQPWQEAYTEWVTYFTPGMRSALYSASFRAAVGEYHAEGFLHGQFARVADADPLQQVSYVDLHSFLPGNLLAYGDRMSMAHGLEVRLPFTDHKLVELALQVPARLKLRSRSKHILKEAMAGILPAPTLKRKKLGLNPPLGIWLRGELAPLLDRYLAPAAVRKTGWFQPEAVARLVEDFRSGRRDYSLHLWSLLVLEQWRRQVLEGEGSAMEAGEVVGAHA
jgi:asparagine synthase (glutamine-hydrolysing)